MIEPYDEAYVDEIEDRGPVDRAITGVLLMACVTAWACAWGAIWLLSGLYVALHFREDHRRPAEDAPSLYENPV